MAKTAVGERDVTINGKTYTLRLDFEAIMAIEGACGVGIVEVASVGFASGTLTTVAKVFHQMLKSGGTDLTLIEAGQLMLEGDFNEIGEAVGDCLVATLAAEGDEAPGKRKTKTRRSTGKRSTR